MKFAWKIAALCCLLTALFAVGLAEDSGTLTLPADVKIIKEEAFRGLTGVERFDLPAGVTEIGAGAFMDSGDPSAELRYYFAPAGVSVGAGAFDNCRATIRLNGVELPRLTYSVSGGGVTITGMSGQPAEVIIPDSIGGKPVVAIGSNAFSGKSALTRVVIPSTVTSIGQNAFRGCHALPDIDLPAGLTSLGSGAFCDCRALTEIAIPAGITALPSDVFSNCYALTDVDLPEGLVTLGNAVFYYCQALTQIDLPAGITALPKEAFRGCYALEEIDLTGITSLGEGVFRECRALTEVSIPASITALPASAFEDAQGLIQVHLPETLTAINNYAFYGCKALTEISIPSGITAINYGTFQNCTALARVQLPAGLGSIAQNAFRNCTALTQINFPAGLTSIGQEAFRDTCVNQTANAIYALPASVEIFGTYAFYNCGAGLLVEKNSEMESFVKANGYTFAYDADNGFRYQYKKVDDVDTLYLTGYKGAGGSVSIPAGPKVIGESAFYENEAITAVTIPSGVVTVDRDAFCRCVNLKQVTMANTITTLNNNAFYGCAKLTNVKFSANLTSIGSDAFDYACTVAGTYYYNLPGGITTLGWTPFSDCGAVLCFDRGSDTAALFQQNQYIYTYTGETDFRYRWYSSEGERLLQYTGSAETVEIPAYIWLIDDDAFKGNTAIRKVVVPEGVTQIGNNVFQNCANLTDITLPASLTLLRNNVFRGCGSNAAEPFLLSLPDDIGDVWANVFTDCPAILLCGIDTATASRISNRGWSFARNDRPDELDIRYKYGYIDGNAWVPKLYDYVGPLTSVRLPDDCANVDSAVLRQKVNNGLELKCAQLSDTAAGLSRAEINFTFPGHEGIRYRIIENVLYVMGYVGGGSQLVIPEATAYINAGWDERIRGGAFQGNGTLTKVVVPEGVTRINDSAFRDCYKLWDITLPSTLKVLEQCVFPYCGRDAAKPFYLALPDNMEGMTGFSGGNHTFSDFYGTLMCSKTSQTAALATDRGFVYTVAGEEDYRYRYESYTENGVTGRRLWLVGYVGTGATVNIPAGIYGMKLQSSGKTRTDWSVFYGYGFNGNETVTKVVIPEGTVEILDGVFTNCYNLADITFPSTLKKLDQNVFRYCGRDAAEPFYFVLPDNLEEMVGRGGGATTFSDCNAVLVCGKTSQTAALLSDRNYVYTVPGEYDYRYRYETYPAGSAAGRRVWLVGYVGESATANIPAGIYGVRLFSHNTESTYWRTFYGDGFYGNETVTKVVIPEGTVVIEDSAFRGCVNLVDITFPTTLKVLKNHAFEQCGKNADYLHYYMLPDDMEEVATNLSAGWGAFTDINKGRLVCAWDSETARLVSNAYTGHYEGYYKFAIKGHETDGLLYRYERYDTATQGEYEYRISLWQYEGSDIEVTIPADCGVFRIENDVFLDRTNLQKVVIPAGVVEIGERAFSGCSVLHEGEDQNVIVIPSGVKKAGNLAFKDLGSAYTSQRFFLVLPASLNEFDINIFTGCNAVLVAPAGSAVAQALFNNWYYYYNTLEDAIAQTNIQYQHYYVDGREAEHAHYGRR